MWRQSSNVFGQCFSGCWDNSLVQADSPNPLGILALSDGIECNAVGPEMRALYMEQPVPGPFVVSSPAQVGCISRLSDH